MFHFNKELKETKNHFNGINLFSRRLTAFGCECGFIKISNFSLKTNKLTFSHTTRFHNYITHLRIYSEKYAERTDEKPQLNVVVSNSILPPVFFWFVYKQKNGCFY